MSARDLISAASDDIFAGRVMMLTFQVAQTVASENPGGANHVARLSYAGMVIRGAEKPKLVAVHCIASSSIIAAAIEGAPALLGSNVADGDIVSALTAIWTARSLAFASS